MTAAGGEKRAGASGPFGPRKSCFTPLARQEAAMVASAFDALGATRGLEAAGIDSVQAEAIANAMR